MDKFTADEVVTITHDLLCDALQTVLTKEYKKYKDAPDSEKETIFFSGVLHGLKEVAAELAIEIKVNDVEVN